MKQGVDDFEDDEEIYMRPAEKGTGNRKKTAGFVIGGALLGGLFGDLFGASEYQYVTEVDYGSFTNDYIQSYADTGLIESRALDFSDYVASVENEADLTGIEVAFSDNLNYDYGSTVVGGGIGGTGGYAADRMKNKIDKIRAEEEAAKEFLEE